MQGEYATGADPTAALIVQLLPLIIIQLLYAVVMFQMSRKQGWNAWAWTIPMLIPGVGIVVFIVGFFTTILKTLDRLNVLEAKQQS